MGEFGFDGINFYMISTIEIRFKGLLQIRALISRKPLVKSFKSYKGEISIHPVDIQLRKRSLLRRLLNLQWSKWKSIPLKEDLFVVKLENEFIAPEEHHVVSLDKEDSLSTHCLWTNSQIKELVKYHHLMSKTLTAKLEID